MTDLNIIVVKSGFMLYLNGNEFDIFKIHTFTLGDGFQNALRFQTTEPLKLINFGNIIPKNTDILQNTGIDGYIIYDTTHKITIFNCSKHIKFDEICNAVKYENEQDYIDKFTISTFKSSRFTIKTHILDVILHINMSRSLL